MALTLEERRIAEELKAKGFNAIEIMSFIGGERNGQSSSIREKIVEKSQSQRALGGLKATISDIPSDLKETFGSAVDAVSTGILRAGQIRERVEAGETTPVLGTLQTIGAGFGAGVRTVGEGIIGLGKTLFSPRREGQIGETVAIGAEKIVGSAPIQEGIRQFEKFSPEAQRNIQAGTEVVEGITTLFGFAPIISKLKKELSPVTKGFLIKADDVLEKTRRANTPKVPVGVAPEVVERGLRDTIKDVRVALSDIDPQVETALKRSSMDDVNRYFQQARQAKIDPSKNTPMEIAGNRAVEAFDAIDEARKNAVRGKKNILERVASQRVPGNTLNDVMARGIQQLNEKFGVRVGTNGQITQTVGRFAKLDASDQKLISEYVSRLNSLGVSPSIKQVDDFIDWSQSQLYKQTKSLSKFEVASEPVVRSLRGIEGDLNTRLKDIVGSGYGEVNLRVSKLIELQDELSRALGADARKGGGLMKRLFSPTGGDTRRIFEEIKQLTGIDLFKEATLAKFAMGSVDDVRQRTLLQSLDVAVQDTATLDLARPLSIVKFIRERADLDGQELANELIRRFANE